MSDTVRSWMPVCFPYCPMEVKDKVQNTIPMDWLTAIIAKPVGAVAQLGVRLVRNEEVAGSIPVGSTKPTIGEPLVIIDHGRFLKRSSTNRNGSQTAMDQEECPLFYMFLVTSDRSVEFCGLKRPGRRQSSRTLCGIGKRNRPYLRPFDSKIH